MRLQRPPADQPARPHPDKRGEALVAKDVAAVAVGRANQRRHRVDDPQQPLMRSRQIPARLASTAVATALPRAKRSRDARLLVAAQPQQIARPSAEFAMVDRAQEMVRRAGCERPVDAVAFLERGDDDRPAPPRNPGRSCSRAINAAASSCAISPATTTRSGRSRGAGSQRRRRIGERLRRPPPRPAIEASRARILRLVALLSTTTTSCDANARLPRGLKNGLKSIGAGQRSSCARQCNAKPV